MTVEEQIEVYKSKIRELRNLKKGFSDSIDSSSGEKVINNTSKFVSERQATWRFDFSNDRVTWSDKLYDIFQVDREISDEKLLAIYFSRLSKHDTEKINEYIELIKEGKKDDYYIVHPVIINNRVARWVACSGFAIKNNGETIGVTGTTEEIIDNFGEYESLNQFFELSLDLHCIANEEGYFLKVSPSWSKLLGYSSAELCSKPFASFVHPDDLNSTIEETVDLSKDKLTSRFENRYIAKNGEIVYLSWSSKRDPVSGLFFCTARNVTKEHYLKESLNNEVRNKDMLLREIHHRVKNNLQIISSLLSLQAKVKYTKKDVTQLLLESQARVKAMASIHEHFYQSKDVSHFNVKIYISKLVNDLVYTYLGSESGIKLNLKIDDCYLNLDEAVPVGLIINELVANALKHAFVGVEEKELHVSLEKIKNTFKITIGDNGLGYEIDFDEEVTDSIGLSIVDGLIEQLGGQFSQINKGYGTWVEIKF